MGTPQSSIKEQLILLAELQQLDIEIAELERELSGVQLKMDEFDHQLSAMGLQVDESGRVLDVLKKQYRADESVIRDVEDTVAKTKSKLNSVKTNKEYQAMLKAIDDLKLKNSELEDKMLDALDQIEAAEANKLSLQADFNDLKLENEEKKGQVTRKAEEEKEKVSRLQQERDVLWQQLPEKWQSLYRRAVHQGRGIGVTAVIEAVCQVCRVNLPPQLYIDLMRMKSMLLCPSCQRVMYPDTIWENKLESKPRPR